MRICIFAFIIYWESQWINPQWEWSFITHQIYIYMAIISFYRQKNNHLPCSKIQPIVKLKAQKRNSVNWLVKANSWVGTLAGSLLITRKGDADVATQAFQCPVLKGRDRHFFRLFPMLSSPLHTYIKSIIDWGFEYIIPLGSGHATREIWFTSDVYNYIKLYNFMIARHTHARTRTRTRARAHAHTHVILICP